jgi:hypothetical protein
LSARLVIISQVAFQSSLTQLKELFTLRLRGRKISLNNRLSLLALFLALFRA